MRMIIKCGQVVDPKNFDSAGLKTPMDIIIKEGRIVDIKEPKENQNHESTDFDRVIDARGKIVTPGLIDMHVHLREPGHEYKETIASGCLAAAHGGFTAICCMPNTSPVNDNSQITQYIKKQAEIADLVHVYPIGAISPGLKGKGLNEFGDLKRAGVVAVSDDGNPVTDSMLMRRALEYAKGFGLLVISHCEDISLAAGGAMNEGYVATKMGLSGIPNAAESTMVMRDIALSELTSAKVHIAHVSTKESVHIIRDAKKRGVPVTAETAPHYFTLTEDNVDRYNTNAKMNPPLRSKEDRDAIKEGLFDGTIDVIATDHAPHTSIEKEVEFDRAANGVIGLETSLSLGLKLVEEKVLTIESLVEKMSANPAIILGLENGIKIGNMADITIIDPDVPFKVDSERFCSKSRNTPFNGWDMRGKAVFTMVEGRIVFDDIPSDKT
jgi:dihydroorotase